MSEVNSYIIQCYENAEDYWMDWAVYNELEAAKEGIDYFREHLPQFIFRLVKQELRTEVIE